MCIRDSARNDRGLKLEYTKVAGRGERIKNTKKKKNPEIVAFWLSLMNEYTAITKKT